MKEYSLAEIWERLADELDDREALIHDTARISWRQYEDHASRLARTLVSQGLSETSKVALYMRNCSEYLVGAFAALKIGAVPVNVNFRYEDDELAYLLDNSDSEAIIFGEEFAPHIMRAAKRLPKIKLMIQVGDSAIPTTVNIISYTSALNCEPLPRRATSPSDIILLYTGGTTGLPKGVMHRSGTLSLAFRSGLAPNQGPPPNTLDDIVRAVLDSTNLKLTPRHLVPCPLMHGVGWWSAMSTHTRGGTVITYSGNHFDPQSALHIIEREGATNMCIVGDVFAKPLLLALRTGSAKGKPHDISSLREINSSGAMWSSVVKHELLEIADLVLVDAMGSSEGGTARQVTKRGDSTETAQFRLNSSAKVFTEDNREIVPGSTEVGMLATSQNIPIGYYKDPEKSARTFRYVDGIRYSFPGDYALVEADGSIRLLGRGSICINSGGEKIYPEEVEEVIKLHPCVADCLVVGIPDEYYGERVVAVVSARSNDQPDETTLRAFVKSKLAHYKAPKQIFVVDSVHRAPNGKADYKWAKDTCISMAQKQD